MTKIIAWNQADLYLAVETPAYSDMTPARIVDLTRKRISEPILIGSIIVQEEPDVWRFDPPFPDADEALALITAAPTA